MSELKYPHVTLIIFHTFSFIFMGMVKMSLPPRLTNLIFKSVASRQTQSSVFNDPGIRLKIILFFRIYLEMFFIT